MYKEGQVRRSGKTQRDRDSGQASRNDANKKARVAWQQDNNPSKVFPKASCNGKKNRHRGMEKGANYMIHA